ncbi:MAG: glycoside hydrolase [Tannerellaceae bacterium]|jgi:alpha-mannosidase|nr:glycoside hydrolase [Tannerellaceae bacterium]
MKEVKNCLWIVTILLLSINAYTQNAYFIDGYHGGIYGHYPLGQTNFMSDKLTENPDWAISIEIEPESWDVVKLRDPEGYAKFQKLFKEQSVNASRIEYVNPSYAQSYFFGTSGESNIRQFTYGMEMVRKHFPTVQFTTYSAEEPCFTSSLPYLLKSLGFTYASTKNPNTMWGGYTAAYGGELVNWIGPDGTKILAVPRYACEDLKPGSTWQTIASYNSKEYIRKCFEAGIKNPTGMCIQDAAWSNGWNRGPWLGNDTSRFYTPTHYRTWRNYIANFTAGATNDDWHFTQEDVLTSLVWGSQVMQTLAQEVRTAENNIVQAEKIAALTKMMRANSRYPKELIDEGWVRLLLSQHHDCWIVPYNNLQGGRTWAQHVSEWTSVTNENSRTIIERSLAALNREGSSSIRLYNTLAAQRNEIVRIRVPSMWKNQDWAVTSNQGIEQSAQIIEENGESYLLFRGEVPSFGYTTCNIRNAKIAAPLAPEVTQKSGKYILESDLYTLVIDPAKGGTIESLKAKKPDNKEYVDSRSKWRFNELRGFFGVKNDYISSSQQPATVRILEEGAVSVKIAIDGMIGEHPFTQTIRLMQGEEKIDMTVYIDWQGNPAIGEPGISFSASDPRKAFYDDRYKLLVCFPATIQQQQIYKDAPYDVCMSRNANTHFNSWNKIKHNIILNWVDLASRQKDYGLTMFTDHTTSYVHGEEHPLALTLQFSGQGLWGRNYIINRPTSVSYALLPHKGVWDEKRIWTKSEQAHEPIIGVLTTIAIEDSLENSFLRIQDNAYELSAVEYKGNDMYIRLFNAQSDNTPKQITYFGRAEKIEWVELNGEVSATPVVSVIGTAYSLQTEIPRLGIRTLKITNTPL